ncbi:MAG: hypothetical protein IJU14_01155 [Clostridia bacterium]|nr:hypothetical protein [Clostridia bacterium]
MTINWFDMVLLAGIIVIAVRGYFRGAVGFLIWTLGGIISAFFSSMLGKNLAPWIYAKFIRTSIEEKIVSTVTEVFEQGIDNIGHSIFNTMPSFVWKFTDYDDVVYALDSVTGNNIQEISSTATDIVSSIVEPIYVSIISAFVTIILFLIFNIAIGIICKATKVFNKIPLFGGVNRVLGIFMGVLYGCFLAWILACVIAIVVPVFDKNGTFREKVETNSFVFNAVNKHADGLYFFSDGSDETDNDETETEDSYGNDDYGYDEDYSEY